jgi:SAM-dependent methyltransferase
MTPARDAPPALYDLAPLYDRVVTPGPCGPFNTALAREAAGPVLELACGTGRLAVPLARNGHEVVGLDASPAMLRAARAKARAAGLEVALVEGDMRSFALPRRFGLVVVGCNSLAHLTGTEDLLACLAAVRRHLAPGGILAFDAVNPDLRALARAPSEAVRLDLGPNPSSGIPLEEVASYDPVRQVRTARLRLCGPGPGSPAGELAALHLRLIFPQELPLLLGAAGLELAARFGDFARNPLAAGSLNQVCIARGRGGG